MPSRKTPFFLFGLGQLSRSILWCVTDLLIGYHLVERVGFSGQVAGFVMFATIAFSALPDIFVATWLARRRDPAAAALKAQAIFGILAAGAAILLFGPAPSDWVAKIVYVCAMSAVFRFCYAIYDVSQNALISLLPQSRGELRGYVANKTAASSIGRLIASMFVLWALSAAADRSTDLTVLILVALPVIVSAFGLLKVDLPAPRTTGTLRFEWKALPFGRLALPMAAIAFQVGLLGLVCRLLPLVGNGRPGIADSGSLVVAMVCGMVAGPSLAYKAGQLGIGRLPLAAGLSLCATIAGVLLMLSQGADLSLGLATLYGVALSGITNMIWERVALIATESAEETGQRIDAPAFALLTTTIKLAIAMCTIIFGFVLDGYRAGGGSSVTTIIAVVTFGGLGTAIFLAFDHPWRQLIPTSHRLSNWLRPLRWIMRAGTSQ